MLQRDVTQRDPSRGSGEAADRPREAEDRPRGADSFLRANRVSLVSAAIAAGLAAIVYFGMPHERDLTSLWVLLFKLTPFVAAAIAIAWLDEWWAQRLRLALILPPLCFLAFFTFFVPRIFYSAGIAQDFNQLYYTVLMLVPFVILALVLSVRLGGGSRATVLRLAAAMILLQLSGIEDLAFLTVNDLSGTDYADPQVWFWADHMAVRLGHYPTTSEAYAFIAGHVALAVLVLALPQRSFRAIGRRLRRR